MQANSHLRPLERSDSQEELPPVPAPPGAPKNPEAAARQAQLLRLGTIPGGAPRAARELAGSVSLLELKLHSSQYLDDMALCNKPATIAAKRAAYERLVWYLEVHSHTACGEREIRGFLSYVKNAHLRDDGRWGRAVKGDTEAARFARPATARTVEYYFVYIRALYRWLLECEIIERDPTAKIKIEKPDDPLILPFSKEQVKALRRAARTSNLPERNEAIVVLMFDTGLRAAELCNMTLHDLEMKMSVSARRESGYLLRELQKGETLSPPFCKPMPSIGLRCYELRVQDKTLPGESSCGSTPI